MTKKKREIVRENRHTNGESVGVCECTVCVFWGRRKGGGGVVRERERESACVCVRVHVCVCKQRHACIIYMCIQIHSCICCFISDHVK